MFFFPSPSEAETDKGLLIISYTIDTCLFDYVTALLEYLDFEMCKDCALMVMHPAEHSSSDSDLLFCYSMFKFTANVFTVTFGHSVPLSIMK